MNGSTPANSLCSLDPTSVLPLLGSLQPVFEWFIPETVNIDCQVGGIYTHLLEKSLGVSVMGEGGSRLGLLKGKDSLKSR